MTVKIGHASIDERGKIKGGTAGDQTGKELCIRNYYKRSWTVVLRPNDPIVAEKSAKACEDGCNNPNIGYDQNQRNSLHSLLKKNGYKMSTVGKCETDCSAFMTACAISAGVTKLEYASNAPTTSTMRKAFVGSGAYTALIGSTYLNSDMYLKRGDILVSEGHHTVMVLSNGEGIEIGAKYIEPSVIVTYNRNNIKENVKWVQNQLNRFGYSLVVDGVWTKTTNKTHAAVVDFQQKHGLLADGEVGPLTRAELKK